MRISGQSGLPDSRCIFQQAREYCLGWQALLMFRAYTEYLYPAQISMVHFLASQTKLMALAIHAASCINGRAPFAIARTSNGSPLSSSRERVMASEWHCPTHTPHPIHLSQFTTHSPSTERASKGQKSTQVPQASHIETSISAT